MAEVRKIQCPSCGSNSTYKLFDGSYKCNYCQGSFMVNEGQQPQRPAQINRNLSSTPTAATKKIIVAIVAAFMILGMAMAGFLVMKTSMAPGIAAVDTERPAQQAVIKKTMAFAGARGAVIWIVSEKSYSTDSLCYELRVVDPQANTLKGKWMIGTPFKRNTGADLSQLFGSRFLKFGELAYSITNDTGLTAYDIYSGKRVLTTQSIASKIPGRASGILKVEYASSENIFKVSTTSGDVLRFDPFSQAFIPAPEPKGKREEAVTKELYLSDGLKHNLYLFTKRGDGFPIVFGEFVQESHLPGPTASKTNNVKDIFGNMHIEKISEKNYFRAQPLLIDVAGNLLVLYKTDLSQTSPVILESINKEGKTNWSLQDTSFSSIGKAFASEDLGCYYTFSDTILVIGLDKEEREYMAIDVNTGKVLWHFDPKKYMEQQPS